MRETWAENWMAYLNSRGRGGGMSFSRLPRDVAWTAVVAVPGPRDPSPSAVLWPPAFDPDSRHSYHMGRAWAMYHISPIMRASPITPKAIPADAIDRPVCMPPDRAI